MKGRLLLMSFFMLASCASGEESDLPEDNNVEETPNDEIEETPDLTVTDKSPRMIEQADYVEFIESHEEASFLQEEDFVDPEKIDFTLTFWHDPGEVRLEGNRMDLRIEVEEGEELILGSTHFRIEYYDGNEWGQVDNVPYGDEDAQAIVTSEEPFEYSFYDIDQFETEFDTGEYRIVNSGYAFHFTVVF